MSEAIKIIESILNGSKRKGDCLVCYFGLDKNGYSQTSFDGKQHRTTRIVMHLVKDFDLDSPLFILHDENLCKSKACIEVNHLRAGTASENAGTTTKGRRKVGCSRHPNVKRRHNGVKTYCPQCKTEATMRWKRKQI